MMGWTKSVCVRLKYRAHQLHPIAFTCAHKAKPLVISEAGLRLFSGSERLLRPSRSLCIFAEIEMDCCASCTRAKHLSGETVRHTKIIECAQRFAVVGIAMRFRDQQSEVQMDI